MGYRWNPSLDVRFPVELETIGGGFRHSAHFDGEVGSGSNNFHIVPRFLDTLTRRPWSFGFSDISHRGDVICIPHDSRWPVNSDRWKSAPAISLPNASLFPIALSMYFRIRFPANVAAEVRFAIATSSGIDKEAPPIMFGQSTLLIPRTKIDYLNSEDLGAIAGWVDLGRNLPKTY